MYIIDIENKVTLESLSTNLKLSSHSQNSSQLSHFNESSNFNMNSYFITCRNNHETKKNNVSGICIEYIARIFRRLQKNPSGVATEECWKAVKIGAEVAFEVAFPWHKRPS